MGSISIKTSFLQKYWATNHMLSMANLPFYFQNSINIGPISQYSPPVFAFIKISTSLSPSIPLFHRLTSPNHHANIVLLRVVSSKRWGEAPLILHISLKSIYFLKKVNKKLYFLRKSSKNTCILLFYGTF